MKLFAADPTALESFAPITGRGGETLSLSQLEKGEVFLNADAAEELGARVGDAIVVYPSGEPFRASVREVVDFDGAGTADAALLLPLAEAQRIYDKPQQILGVMISNRGSGDAAVALSDRVEAELQPVLDQWQLDVATVKQDTIEAADEAGSAFMAFFTTFGSFSIAAGILLIFLIFVMLAAERRGELGIARAIGTRRGHLVEMFTFEGAAYDLIAAAVGAILGAVIAYGMVFLMAQAFGAEDADAGLQVEFAFTWQSLLIAFALGVLLTLIVVAFSAWRVSVMTIAAAIRNVPEPPVVRRPQEDRARRARHRARPAPRLHGGQRRHAAHARHLADHHQPGAVRAPRRGSRPARVHRRRHRHRRAPGCCPGAPGSPSSARSPWTSRPGSCPAS